MLLIGVALEMKCMSGYSHGKKTKVRYAVLAIFITEKGILPA